MKGIRVLGIVFVSLFVAACFGSKVTLAQEAEIKDLYIELILDASNSMNELLDGRKKIDIAKQVLNEVLDDLAPDTYLALRIYGSDITKLAMKPGQSKEDAIKVACTDSVLKVGFGKGNAAQAKQIINATEAVGYTPLAYSLELAGGDFPVAKGNNYIILASDGKETCGGDPVAVINALKAKGIKVIVHTIGFAVDEEARLQLQDIAKAGGGNYYSADTADQLKESFKEIIEIIGKEEELFKAKGKEIKPGTGFENAPLLGAGEYFMKNLATTQKYKHTIKVNAVRGQKVKFSAMFTPADELGGMNYVYVNAYNKDLQEIFSRHEYICTKTKPETIAFWVAPYEEETYYLVFTSKLWADVGRRSKIMNIYLKIDVEDRFDANSGRDVPYEFPQALTITPENYDSNWIYPEGDKDKYTLELGPGQTLSVKVFPTEDWDAEVKIFNEDREQVSREHSKNKGAVAKGEYTSKDGEEVYINVGPWTSRLTGKYEMKIKITGGKREAEPRRLETE